MNTGCQGKKVNNFPVSNSDEHGEHRVGTKGDILQLKQQLLLSASQLLSVQTSLVLSDLLGFPDKQRELTLYVNLPIFKYWHLFFVVTCKGFFKSLYAPHR